ncbi:MAG: glycosyltransferase family 2 protein [Lachnospiraceae bacterium]|nr:glycosyltransferase family 2 protein [Lachnospiraceae bacterium]
MISVVIPVHNAEPFIGDTIHSVIGQEYKDWELILVNDHSEDGSLKAIDYFLSYFERKGESDRIRLLHTGEKRGPAAARNMGIDAARGRYIAFLDADDIWEPEKLSEQLEFQEKLEEAFTFTSYEYADESGTGIDKIVRVPFRMTYGQALRNTTIFTSTVMFDTEKIDKTLIHMPDVPSEDTATWWQVLKKGYVAWGLNRPLTLYRRSRRTLSSDKRVAIKRIWNLYRNVEKLNIVHSAFCFCFYAFHAVWRRL